MFAGDSVETAIKDDRNRVVKSRGRKPVPVFPAWIGRVALSLGAAAFMDERAGSV
jgi:hypothetical protein